MTKHLSLEHCQWLKDNGFPQGNTEWFWFETGLEPPHEYGEVSREYMQEHGLDEDGHIADCPDLEELREWALTKIDFMLYRHADGDSIADGDLEENGKDPDPKVAVIKLLQQVMGEAPKKEKVNE